MALANSAIGRRNARVPRKNRGRHPDRKARLETRRECRREAANRVHTLISDADAMLTGNDSPMDGVIAEVLISTPAISIAGGTDKIQKNIISERVSEDAKETRSIQGGRIAKCQRTHCQNVSLERYLFLHSFENEIGNWDLGADACGKLGGGEMSIRPKIFMSRLPPVMNISEFAASHSIFSCDQLLPELQRTTSRMIFSSIPTVRANAKASSSDHLYVHKTHQVVTNFGGCPCRVRRQQMSARRSRRIGLARLTWSASPPTRTVKFPSFAFASAPLTAASRIWTPLSRAASPAPDTFPD